MSYGRHRSIPWYERNEVRIRGYIAGSAVVTILVGRGFVNTSEGEAVLIALAAILGVWGIETSATKSVPKAVAVQEKRRVAAAVAAGRPPGEVLAEGEPPDPELEGEQS